MPNCYATRATGEPGSCPVCGERGWPVPRETLEHLLRPQKRAEIIDEPYYFCETPECDIVYFADVPLHFFDKDDLTVRVGIKESESQFRSATAWDSQSREQ